MPSVRAKAFQQTFATAFARGARLAQDDVDALAKAARALQDPKERAAAVELLKLVKDDHALDADEVDKARAALCRLLGTSPSRLPKALERILAGAVPVPNVDVREYDLTFDLSRDAPTFPARAVIRLEEAVDGTAILEADPERLTIHDVRAGGKRVPFWTRDGRLYVEAGASKTLDVRYDVTPTDDVHGYGLIRDEHAGRIWTLTWPYSTGALFPSKSDPSDGATARVTVRVAGGHDVVGPGRSSSSSSSQAAAFRVREEVPAYALSFYAGRFTDQGKVRSSGVDVVTQGLGGRVRKETRAAVRDAVAHAVDYMSRWLGPYPHGDRLNVVEVDHSYGGMEHAGAVAVAAAPKAELVETSVHEAIHAWFGTGVRIAVRGEYWMSEGFTQYATFRCFEEREGAAAWHKLLDAAKDLVRAQLKTTTAPLSMPAAGAAYDDFFTDLQYQQGPWMLRMLEVRFGRERFDALVKDWYAAKKGDAVTTADFVAFVAAKTGEDTGPFFAAWNALGALPSYQDGSRVVGRTIDVKLTAKTPLPPGTRIPLVVVGTGGQRAVFDVDPATPQSFTAPFSIRRVAWDPERTVLCDVVARRR